MQFNDLSLEQVLLKGVVAVFFSQCIKISIAVDIIYLFFVNENIRVKKASLTPKLHY